MSDLLNTIKPSSGMPVFPVRQASELSVQSSFVKAKPMQTSAALLYTKPELQKDSFLNSIKQKFEKTPRKTRLLAGGTLIAAVAFLIGLKFRPTSAERAFRKIADKKICSLSNVFEKLKRGVSEIADSKKDAIKKIVDPIVRENKLIRAYSRKVAKMDLENSPELRTEVLDFIKKHKEKAGSQQLCAELDMIYTEIVVKTKGLCDDAVDKVAEIAELSVPSGLKGSKTSKEDFLSYLNMKALLLDNIEKGTQNMEKDVIREKVCEQFRIGFLVKESKSILHGLAQRVEQSTKSIT